MKFHWHKHKAQKDAPFLWSIIHKVEAVNECCGRILVEIDKSYSHYGLQFVE